MLKILVSTLRLISLVSLAGLAGGACRRDEFAVAYLESRAELLGESANRFGSGRLTGVSWSPPLSLPTSAPAPTTKTTNNSTAATRGGGVRALSPIEYAKKGLENLVDPGEGFTVDRLVMYFELAFPVGQRDPSYLNDYAFALLERGLPRDLILAGEYAARARNAAIKDAPHGELSQAARFNLAVALERLALHGQATQVWQEVLDHETDPDWRTEAQTHAASLAQWPVVRWPAERKRLRQAAAQGDTATVAAILPEFRTAVRLLAEDDELKVWAETIQNDPIRAKEALTVARTIGEVLEKQGDALLADVVASIDDDAGDVKKTMELAAAVRGFLWGLEEYKERNFERARETLLAVDAELAKLGNPLALRAAFLALVSSDQLGLGEILDWSDDLLQRRVAERYTSLRAQILYARGWLRSRAGFHEASLANLEQAVRQASALGEDLAASYGSHFGSVLDLAHDSRAEAVDQQWLDRAQRSVTPYGRYFVAYAVQYRAMYYQPLAPAVGEAAVLEAASQLVGMNQPIFAAETKTDLYLSALMNGDSAEATRYRNQVESEIALLASEESRRFSQGMVDWAVAKNPRATSMARERSLQRALNSFSGHGPEPTLEISQLSPSRKFAFHQLSLLNALADLKLEEQQTDEAAQYAGKALEMLAARFASERPLSGGHDLAGEVRPLLKTLLQAELAQATPVSELFDRIEWALHLAAPGAKQPSNVMQIAARLPEDTTLVELVPVGDRLLVFLLGHAPKPLVTFDLQVVGLSSRIACLGPRDRDQAVCGRSWEDEAAQFAREGVEPWLCTLTRGARLVLVPGPLGSVPFAGLPIRCPNEQPGRIVARHVTSLAPSATSFLEGHARALELGRQGPPTSVLAVGVLRAPDAPKLTSAPLEAQTVRSRYLNGVLLLNEQATKEATLRGLSGMEVLHLASHGEVDRTRFDASFLALADGRLSFADLASQRDALKLCRLAVLAACDTGGSLQGVEGLVGVSRAFLDLGVPTVVATLASVNDRLSHDLMEIFHRRFLETGDAALALAEAQREEAGAEAPEVRKQQALPEWAKWVVVGG